MPTVTLSLQEAPERARAAFDAGHYADAEAICLKLLAINAQDFFAPPVLAGTYTNHPLTLPMTNLTVAIPNGLANTNAVPRTGKEFNVFVLIGASSRPQSRVK